MPESPSGKNGGQPVHSRDCMHYSQRHLRPGYNIQQSFPGAGWGFQQSRNLAGSPAFPNWSKEHLKFNNGGFTKRPLPTSANDSATIDMGSVDSMTFG